MYFFSQNVAVNLYPVYVVARVFELSVAIMFVCFNFLWFEFTTVCGSSYLIYCVFVEFFLFIFFTVEMCDSQSCSPWGEGLL